MSKRSVGFKIGLTLVAAIGLVQAGLITVTQTDSSPDQGNITWQDIKSVSYTWNDVDGDGKVAVGDNVTFAIDMHKNTYGTHDYDALKVWIDGTPVNAPVSGNPAATIKGLNYPFIWDYDATSPSHTGEAHINVDTLFKFDYSFSTTGTHNLVASVMCSRDLSDLYGDANDAPTITDWGLWRANEHALNHGLQGEDEQYQLSVVSKNVPEASSFSLIFLGFMSLAGSLFIRRKK